MCESYFMDLVYSGEFTDTSPCYCRSFAKEETIITVFKFKVCSLTIVKIPQNLKMKRS